MTWNVVVREKAHKIIQKLPSKDASRIMEVLDNLTVDPFGGDIQKMAGETNAWRRRTGAYRIFYEVSADKRIILVYRIERRTSKTY